jgi:hypothetical protein
MPQMMSTLGTNKHGQSPKYGNIPQVELSILQTARMFVGKIF